MVWGNGAGSNSQQPEWQHGQGGPNAPTPPYPMSQAPTPPYAPGQAPTPPYQQSKNGSPLQRLAEAHRGGHSSTRRPSAHPDGTPAPLPASVISRLGSGGGSGGQGGRARVIQRFSGSGLAPKTKVQRQERRARRATGLLALAAVVLIASSAILIFDPAIELPSFGFAFNQRLHKQNSDVPLYVDGTQPPTPTTSGTSPTPTATPNGSNGPNAKPTATPKPAVIPTPTYTPTPTPTVIPSGAEVKFTPSSTQINKSTFKGCGSGCDFQSANGQGSGPLSSGGSYGPSGYQSTEVAGPYNVTQKPGKYCYYPLPGTDPKCVTSYYAWNPTNRNNGAPYNNPGFTMTSPNLSCSGITIPSDQVGVQVQSSWCWLPTTQNPVYANSFCGTTAWSSPPDPSDGSWHDYFFSFCNAQWNSVAHYTYVTSGDCNNAINSADPNAKNGANSAAASWLGGRVSLYEAVAPINNSSVRYCSPATGTHTNSATTGHVEWSWSATAFDPNAVVSAAGNWVKSQVPSGYTLTAGPTTCSASDAGSSGNYSYSGGYNGTLTVTCAASGTATYDWSSATQGMTAQNNLKSAIEGKTLSHAQSICNNFTGIQPGSCSIQLTGGNVSIIPNNPSQIQIQPS